VTSADTGRMPNHVLPHDGSVRSVHVLSRKYIERYILAQTCHYRIGRGIRRAAGGADGPHTGHHPMDAGKTPSWPLSRPHSGVMGRTGLYSANADKPGPQR